MCVCGGGGGGGGGGCKCGCGCANMIPCYVCCIVGEPLPTAAWKWYYENVGKQNCILVDTYWQTGMYV